LTCGPGNWQCSFICGSASVEVKTLHGKIGELTLENDFLSDALGMAGLLGDKK